MLKALRVISIDELSEVEPEGIPPAGDPVPRALVQSVALLQTSLDRFTRRSLRLLKILTVLSQGEVFSVVRRFDQKAPFYPENIQELQDRGLLETVPFTTTAPELPSSAGVTMFDASSPKLLVIPRQVRDYVQSIMDEDERRAIVERALEVYFGPRWREGEAKLPPTTRLRIREGSIGGTGNAHIVAVWLFRDALQRRDLDTSRKIVRLTETYLEALLDADRYRDVYLAAQEVFHLVEVSDLKPQTARIAALAGRALRMTGNQDEAIKLLEKALEYATPELGKRWQSYVYLNLALAHESAGDINAAITAATQVEGLAEPHSAVAYQARSVLLECRAGENWDASSDTYRSLAKLERDARAKDYYVVANNIALTLAERTKSQQAKAEARERVLRTREDVYNRIRAVVDKANDLQATGRHSEITPREQRFLAEAYSYLYSQRFVSLFDRCHRVLWRMFKQEHKAVLLLRLFRFSSFIWRIYGKTRRERDYLRELQAEYPPSLLSSSEAIGSDEMGYYVARTRAIEGTGSQ
jgi:tetratricopeptide (TPR) repeat protein